jgi:hypothetical protein
MEGMQLQLIWISVDQSNQAGRQAIVQFSSLLVAWGCALRRPATKVYNNT